MKRLITRFFAGQLQTMIAGLSLLAGLFLLSTALPQSSGSDRAVGAATASSVNTATSVSNTLSQAVLTAPQKQAGINPAHVMGAKACINCHRSEYLAWMKTKHHVSEATIRGTGGNIAKFAEAYGIKESNVRKDLRCTKCHATSQADKRGRVRAISGVSCESCHGSAGSETGWLNRHAVYGPNVTPANKETAQHRKSRIEFSEKAGMIRAERLYSIAKNCYECHSVTDEKLVNAGHKIGTGFELIGWSIGEARHNFHENQAINGKGPSLWMKATGRKMAQRRRVKFIVGVLVDLEFSLTALGSVTDGEGDFVTHYRERLGGALEILGGIVEALEDDAPDELGEVTETVEGVEAEDSDFGEQEARKRALEAAKKIAEVARKFAARDGSKLAGVDEFMNEEVVEVKGKVFSR